MKGGITKPEKLSRREFLKAASAGTAATTLGALSLSAEAEDKLAFDAEFDVVVCGGGGGGLATALFSRWHGNSVVILEKAGSVGGTAAKAAFWYWVPNNGAMKKKGIQDPKADFLKLIARITNAQTYDPNAPKFGLTDWQYAMCEAFYDSGADAVELLAEKGALPYRHVMVDDYWKELPENKAPQGRVLIPKDARESMSDGGRVAIGTMSRAARRDGVAIRTSHRVQRVLLNSRREVIGVEALTAAGAVYRVRAKKGVIFATGGFTHDPELRANFLEGPFYGGCAALSNEGDFVRISSTLGVELRNMNHAWMCPNLLEKTVAKDGSMSGIFTMVGDSMVIVNKYGRRVANEKLCYNELARSFFSWDGAKSEYPNVVLISIWDQRSQLHSASDEYGAQIVPSGADGRHVIKGDTLEQLAANIKQRLAKYVGVTGVATADDFLPNLKKTIGRFNEFAHTGEDLDFHRGERAVEILFNGNIKHEPSQHNETMWPISDQGPYYAALLVAGTLDTKGGPKTDPDARVLDYNDQPIRGLYGVGNCVASPSGGSYWAGGSTLGPILTFSYRAANAVNKEPVKT
ncbi:FAD-dependent oxidoreductase [Aromatoleum toluclasticum]|uniref:FAD-dependent oxidoreductase n=1 Tax=Aromatoleum toluclasticum TaxID=92003 RepID=UPI001D180C2A|nr:FAD-dependent oxidoreductase [Aromatoleum toluclasticum]MCC4118463.1 FAD-dependent oxidoreductase [Aromatoleum toluclasticum]